MGLIRFFDKLEDKIRTSLSHRPIIYALFGSVGIILLWRGVWLTADMFDFMTPLVSVAIGLLMLLLIGLFVSFFIGEQIIISGIKAEKRTDEKTEEEIRREEISLRGMKKDISDIKDAIRDLAKYVGKIAENKTINRKR